MASDEVARRQIFADIDTDPEALSRSLSRHKGWRTQYRKSVEGRINLLRTNPSLEARAYLEEEWVQYVNKCKDIECGTNILININPTKHDDIMAEGEIQSEEYVRLSKQFSAAMASVPSTSAPAPIDPTRITEPKIKKELVPDILTQDTTPVEFRKFQRDFKVYFKESYMIKASKEGQRHYLLKCLDAELGERLLANTTINSPIFREDGNNNQSCMEFLTEEFHRRYPVTNRRKDFFLQSQGQGQFTAYITKLKNMAVEADLGNVSAEDLIVVMGIVGCRDDELRGDLQKLARPTLQNIMELGEAHERKIFAERGYSVKTAAVSHSKPPANNNSQGNRPIPRNQNQQNRKLSANDDPIRRKEIEKLMKGKCYKCGDNHSTDACNQKFGKLNCNLCNRKGHLAKACYSEMLKKSATSNSVQAQAVISTPATTYAQTAGANQAATQVFTAPATNQLPLTHIPTPPSVVNIGGSAVDLGLPPKPTPQMWM